MSIEVGARASLVREVGAGDTARALGSGDLEVLATPRLLAWCEAATLAAVGALEPDRSTVGTRVELEHLRASAVGQQVELAAELVHVDGRLLRFEVAAVDGSGVLVGRAVITRVLVDRQRFLSRL
ncbi:MAG: thioesterase family protein [Actinomycetes bacterium]